MPCCAFRVAGLLVDSCHVRGRPAFGDWVGAGAVEQAVFTHHHEDHAGNAALLNARGIVPWAHRDAVSLLARRRVLPPFQRVIWGTPEPAAVLPAPPRIEAGPYVFRVVDTPGHCGDHIVLWEENEGWLFSGDLFLADRLSYLCRDEDLALILASLDKVLGLSFATVFCGHRGRVADGRRMLARKRDFLLELGETVRELFAAGCDEKEITRRLLGREGPMNWISLGLFSKRRLVHRLLGL